MMRTIPKHKGTEKMQADLKRRMSQLKKEALKKKSTPAQRPSWYVEREGAGQVIVCGPPNSGKSQLLTNLTEVPALVADYPFTTRSPQPAMMRFEDIQIQMVDTPPLAREILEPWQLAQIKQADAALLVFDVNDPQLLEQTEYVLQLFSEKKIPLDTQSRPKVIVLGNKTDTPSGRDNFQVWAELYQERFRPLPFSAVNPSDIARLRADVFGLLEIVRVYTKAPGKKVQDNPTPFVLKKGATVMDAAQAVHKDLAANLRFARLWREGSYDGLMVERTHQLQDRDLIEIHA
ncbi:MAG: TGS domain-containing protein [Acidobacteria bacterium]|nr:MAG: TGS domain-containing protein [Acidobacteriota bacterium]